MKSGLLGRRNKPDLFSPSGGLYGLSSVVFHSLPHMQVIYTERREAISGSEKKKAKQEQIVFQGPRNTVSTVISESNRDIG